MKISKLFHWLYAFLMFLPIVLFIPNAFYYGFNEHATNTETTTINYKYQSNEVNTIDDLVEGNIYHLDEIDFEVGTLYEFSIKVFTCEESSLSTFEVSDYDLYEFDYKDLSIIFNYYEDRLTYEIWSNSNYLFISSTDGTTTLKNVDFVINGGFNSFKSYCTSYQILPQYTDYNVIESVDINTDDTISNKMYQAWQSTWNLPLLQWTHTSFVAQPFTYITGLFGVPSDSTLNYIFAYFVSISICWLVFDLLMYVPNLAHRWLDRSALE